MSDNETSYVRREGRGLEFWPYASFLLLLALRWREILLARLHT